MARESSDADSLVEEGEQVAHHHQSCPGDAQQDFADTLRPLVHVLDPCGSGEKKKRSWFHISAVRKTSPRLKTKRARCSHGNDINISSQAILLEV